MSDPYLRTPNESVARSIVREYYTHGAYVVAFAMFLLYLIGAPPPGQIAEVAPGPEEHW